MRKPWYIWLSLLALVLLWGDTGRRIIFAKSKDANEKYDNMGIWYRAVGNIAKLTIIYMMLPVTIFGIVTTSISNYGYFWETFLEWIALLILYLCGVYASYKHVIWREENIPHLLNKSGKSQEEKEQLQ